ncbi:MAG: DUF4388 domain-containing protein [Acidobacteriota bacterium]
MSLSGSLAQVALPHLLQLVATNGFSGKLLIRRAEDQGLLVFRDGQIIYSATNAARETFGSILLMRGLVSREILQEALVRQSTALEEQRLGSLLLEMGVIDEATVLSVLREQVEQTLAVMFQWSDGLFKFEPLEIPERGEMGVDLTDFVVAEGLPTDEIVERVMDRLRSSRQEPGATLGILRQELAGTEVTAEMSSRILEVGADVFQRCLLFQRVGGELRGVGQRGIEGGDDRVRELRVSLQEPSVLRRVVAEKIPFWGPLDPSPVHGALSQWLGRRPTGVMVVPIAVNERVSLVFFGDRLESASGWAPPSEIAPRLAAVGRLSGQVAT